MSMEYIAETDGEMRMRENRNEKLRCPAAMILKGKPEQGM